jgi:hypothetical protein
MKRLSMAAVAGTLFFATCETRAEDVDVPFVTTPDSVVMAMLTIANVSAKDRLIDLGSGDGRIVITAAKRWGTCGLGVEIEPRLVAESRRFAKIAGVEHQVEFREQDLFATDLASATVITMYLLPAVNLQLRPRLLDLSPGTRVVSHDWDMGDWQPDASTQIAVPNKSLGREKFSRVFLWVVPAKLAGAWCRADQRIDIEQHYQFIQIRLSPRIKTTARLQGYNFKSEPGTRGVRVTGALSGDRLQLAFGEGTRQEWQRCVSATPQR